MGWLSRLFAPPPSAKDTRFGYCVIGTGHGAQKMCEALRSSPHARVAAVMSSSLERARKFARRYGIPASYSYDQFAELEVDARVDAVYVAVPVGPHRTFTERAAAAGKHVLCEKPMAASVSDAEAMIAACAAAGHLLMIAYRLDYDPMHAEVQRLLDAGALGPIRRVTAAFGIVAKPGWRFDPALAGGGSLFDVGIYPIHAIRNFFGDPALSAATIQEDAATGLELDAAWEGTLANGATLACHSSYIARDPDRLHIEGHDGWLELTHAFAYERTELTGQLRDGTRLSMKHAKREPSLFQLEAEHLARCVREGIRLRSPGESGLRDLQTLARLEAMAVRTKR